MCIHLGKNTILLQLPTSGTDAASTAHGAAELTQIKARRGAQIDQHSDEVLVGGEQESAVRTAAQDRQNRWNGEGTEESPGPSTELEFHMKPLHKHALSTPTTEKEPQKTLGDTGEIIFLNFR